MVWPMPASPTHDPGPDAPNPALTGLSVVVLGKAPAPGRVKTRLTRGQGALSPEAAADVAAAMMRATLERVSAHTGVAADRRFLAIDQPQLTPDWAHTAGWTVIDQGDGSLGDRIARAWDHAGPGPVAFFGVDCPDVPDQALAAITPTLAQADAAVGPVGDGGYWTLAARQPRHALLHGIDWGTAAVYDQTRQAAHTAGLGLADLQMWHDVDHPEDLVALRRRILDTPRDDALARLDDVLAQHATH